MKERVLRNGRLVEELDEPVKLVIITKCPEKWRLIDEETGEEYKGTKENVLFKHWKRIESD